MIFKYEGKTYHQVELKFYRTGDLDALLVFAPPDEYLVLVVTWDGVHRADAAEIRLLAAEHGMTELLKAIPGQAASAA